MAALNPANVPYLYFVAHPDGHHEFTSTVAAHFKAVKGARKEWDALAAARRDSGRTAPLNVLPDAPASAASTPAESPRKRPY